MYISKEKRRAIGKLNSSYCAYYCIILVMILCSCSPNTSKIVYFKEPKYKGYHTSESHRHGKIHNSHFIPNNHHVNHKLVDEYNRLYAKLHDGKSTPNSLILWMVSYLLTIITIAGLSILI